MFGDGFLLGFHGVEIEILDSLLGSILVLFLIGVFRMVHGIRTSKERDEILGGVASMFVNRWNGISSCI